MPASAFSTKRVVLGRHLTQWPSQRDVYLFTHTLCPYAERVWLALNAKGIEHALVHIDLSSKPRFFTRVSNLVPVLDIDAQVFRESLDIVAELDQRFPDTGLRCEDGDVKRVVRCTDQVVATGLQLTAGRTSGLWGIGTGQTARQVQQFNEAVDEVVSLKVQTGSPFLAGPTITMADIAVWPFLWRFQLLFSAVCKCECEALQSVGFKDWASAMLSLPYVEGMQPLQQPLADLFASSGRLDFFDYTSWEDLHLHPMLRDIATQELSS